MEMPGFLIQWNSIYARAFLFFLSLAVARLCLIDSNYPGARRTRSIVVREWGGGRGMAKKKKNREE